MRSDMRLFLIGGLSSYRAFFNWLNPWMAIPIFVIAPVFQVFLFVLIGRNAGVGDDQFYVIGNALNQATIPCLFAMAFTIEGERWSQTLSVVLVSPARRLPLFLGRAMPVILNGWGVAIVVLLVGTWVFGVEIAVSQWPALLVSVLATSMSVTGLGFAAGAVCLRVRQGAVIANVLLCLLLVFTGVNVALDDMSEWMASVGRSLPMTHGIEASRKIAQGSSLADVSGLLAIEVGIGAVFMAIGMVLLRWFEQQSRRLATLERV
ncbi:MAG: ABC transporter permease [Nocardioides sp.]